MTETRRFEDGTRFDGPDYRIDLHASELPGTSELERDWLNAARDAMHAASSGVKKERPLTPEEEMAKAIAQYSLGVMTNRNDFLAKMDLPLAA
jgi:hypothetical protein